MEPQSARCQATVRTADTTRKASLHESNGPTAAYRAFDGGTEALNTPLYAKAATLVPEQLWFLSAP